MTSHHMHATALIGFDHFPRFQGPGRKRPRSKNSFSATGVVKAVYWAMAPVTRLERISSTLGVELTDGEHRVNGVGACKHEKAEKGSHG